MQYMCSGNRMTNSHCHINNEEFNDRTCISKTSETFFRHPWYFECILFTDGTRVVRRFMSRGSERSQKFYGPTNYKKLE